MLSCCCGISQISRKTHVQKGYSTDDSNSGGTFGTIHDIPAIFNITRCGPEEEIHTKLVDVPSPFKSTVRIDDELEPSRYIFIQFAGIHDSHYIGINEIEFRDADGNSIPYTNIGVDGQEVDHSTVNPAFPPNGWWAVVDGDHSLLFDFGEVTHVKEIYFWCANAASTPKTMEITDSKSPPMEASNNYDETLFFQMAGTPGTDPTTIEFEDNKSCEEIIEHLNNNRPDNKFESFVSSDGFSHFVFYEKGMRTSAYDYFFGREHDEAIALANNTEVEDGVEIPQVELRAMTLRELQAVRAIINSKCIQEGWISSYDQTKLRPEDVNLYDLNQSLILPLTEKRNCAFKELFSSGGSRPTYYVSHWWGESVLDFIRCCEYHAVRRALSPDEATYWVCAHANRQHDLGADLGNDPSESSFNKTMALADGVLLVVDMNVVVTSRIWVDFELYRTVHMGSGLDAITYANGSPHLIAAGNLPNESPYEKNKREQKFPFEHICSQVLKLELHKGDSSQEIDKVRILNTMINHRPLDCKDVLERSLKRDLEDPKYQEDLKHYSISDNAIKAEFACKAISVALCTEGQDYHNFYGFDLIHLIESDTKRKSVFLNDIVSLDSVTDDIMKTLVNLANLRSVERFEINAKGCRNLTDDVLDKIEFTNTLKHLSLNLGYARNITNDALINFMNASLKIPPSLETLDLDLSGFKSPEGNYLPNRYSDLLEALGRSIPPQLNSLKLVSTLDDDDGGLFGLLELCLSLPSTIRTLHLTFEQWDNFKSEMITDLAEALPKTIEDFSICFYNGDHIEDEDLQKCAAQIARLQNLKAFVLSSRSHGRYGYYKTRNINSVEDMMNWNEADLSH